MGFPKDGGDQGLGFQVMLDRTLQYSQWGGGFRVDGVGFRVQGNSHNPAGKWMVHQQCVPRCSGAPGPRVLGVLGYSAALSGFRVCGFIF